MVGAFTYIVRSIAWAGNIRVLLQCERKGDFRVLCGLLLHMHGYVAAWGRGIVGLGIMYYSIIEYLAWVVELVFLVFVHMEVGSVVIWVHVCGDGSGEGVERSVLAKYC